ncbi:MAG: lipoyl synthase [Deltaproteobacteria bacterium]|nr:lipoyl synthase [Deltaproteobacteria bacterium]
MDRPVRKPDWLKVRLCSGERSARLKALFQKYNLHTVCQEARCPNQGECWQRGAATLMLLGDVCTRGCRFCAVRSGNPAGIVDPKEPENIAKAIGEMDLSYVVLTMVNRDDLPDGGAAHIVETVQRIRSRNDSVRIETLVGDFAGNRRDVFTVVKRAEPDVYAHNVEVVPRLQSLMRDARCSWKRSLDTLAWAREAGTRFTKTSIMVGCGETKEEVLDAMRKLRAVRVDLLTIGQYLRPTQKQAEVVSYPHPDEFNVYREAGLEMGFKSIFSGPLVRSSYRAEQTFINGIRNQ